MPEKKCKSLILTKKSNMALSNLGIEILVAVIIDMAPQLDDQRAREIAMSVIDDIAAVPKAENYSLQQFVDDFEKAPVGNKFAIDLYPSLIRLLDPLIQVKTERYEQCRRVPSVDPPPPLKSGEQLWRPLLADWTIKERYAKVLEWLDEERQADSDAMTRGETLPLRRYVPGTSYGSLFFIRHPYPGFLDDQIWMTPGCDLYWVNERDLLLETFRGAVVKVQAVLVLGVVLTIIAVVGATAPAAWSFLASAGSTIVGYGLTNPVQATQLLYAGLECTVTLASGVDTQLPPMTPADDLAFVVQSSAARGLRGAVRVLANVTGTTLEEGKGTLLKLLVKEAQIVTSAKGWLPGLRGLVRMTAPAVGRSTAAITAQEERLAFNWLVSSLGPRLARTFETITEKELKTLLSIATNRFRGVPGFKRVMAEALSSSARKNEGARFTLKYALSILSEKDIGRKAISFEMYVTTGGVLRYVDLWVDGMRYELKSVGRVRGELAKGAGGKLGELTKDLIQTLGGATTADALERVVRSKWVFDARRLAEAGLMAGRDAKTVEREIAEKLWRALSETTLFSGYPRGPELRTAIQGMIVVFGGG